MQAEDSKQKAILRYTNMPPIRTLSAVKPVKSERTHEENQERAYIAASRRSDRSLEARIESARRASEIHKKRTGRALRVTEQDVVNEEMYEEEDEDLPAQYRRLTAHLQTGSADFNRRLQAYLASQHATRAALHDQFINNNYTNQYPNAPHFANHMMPQNMQPQQMLPPQMAPRSAGSYRQSPYPVAEPLGLRPQPFERSNSTASTIENPLEAQQQSVIASPTSSKIEEQRRMSLPLSPAKSPKSASQPENEPSPALSRTGSTIRNLKTEPAAQSPFVNEQHSFSPIHTSPMYPAFSFSPSFSTFDPITQNLNFSPFSTSLPTETQQFLGSSLDPNDPCTSMLMAGSDMMPRPSYSYNPNLSSKGRMSQPASNSGMNQTLSPGTEPETHPDKSDNFSNPPSVMTEETCESFTPAYQFNLDGSFGDPFKTGMTRNNSVEGSPGPITPGEWNSLLNSNVWQEDSLAVLT